jgi:hypothetical protein
LDKRLTLTIVPIDEGGHDIVAFLRGLHSIDLGRYGRILRLCSPPSQRREAAHVDLTDPNCLQSALSVLDGHADVGIVGSGDELLTTTCSEDAASVARQIARRMGASTNDDGRTSFAVGPMFLARTAALLPFAALGELSQEFHSERDGDRVVARASSHLIACSAQAAGLKVHAFDVDMA